VVTKAYPKDVFIKFDISERKAAMKSWNLGSGTAYPTNACWRMFAF